MTRFDAHANDPARSASRDVRSVIAAQPAVFAATTGIVCVAVLIAIGVLAIGQGVLAQAALAIDRTQASVFLSPQLARADADGLRGRIEALPTVSRAVLRTREEALAALAGDGLPALVNRPNPLPDVWIVTLRPMPTSEAGPPLSAAVSSIRQTLAALPGVASVVVDERWIAAVDRWTSLAGRLVAATSAVVLVVLAGLLLCLGFVAGRAAAADRDETVGVRAIATVGVLVGALAVLLAAGVIWGAATWIAASGIDLKPMIDVDGRTLVRLAAGVGAIAVLGSLVGTACGAIGR